MSSFLFLKSKNVRGFDYGYGKMENDESRKRVLYRLLHSRLDERRKELVAASAFDFYFGCTHDLFLT